MHFYEELSGFSSPPSSAVGHERVELYLYSLYGPYGLYRASVPVQGVHLTTFLNPLGFGISVACQHEQTYFHFQFH